MEAATTYGADKLGLRDQRLARVLKQSPQLCSSLALLHDTQEQQRLQALTSEVGYLKYPDVSFADVIIHGRYRIPAKMLVVIGSGDNLRLKFASTRVDVGPFDSPTRRCPAYRSSPTDRYLVLNDTLWRLVVDIYHLSGRFDQPRAD